MRREIAIFFGIIILVGIAMFAYIYYGQEPPVQPVGPGNEISFDQFVKTLQSRGSFSIVMHLEKEDYKNQLIINNCTIGLARSLGELGKNVSNYAFFEGGCIDPNLRNTTQSECEAASIGSYSLNIRYGPSKPRFYENAADIYVNEDFGNACSITATEG